MFHFKKSLLAVLIALGLLMLVLKASNKGFKQDFLSHHAYPVVAEIHKAFSFIPLSLLNFVEKYLTLIHIKEESRQLKTENAKLKIQQQQLQELEQQNERLKALLELSQSSKLELLASQVIGHDVRLKKQTFIINKGSRHGVKQFMGVLHPKGVLGFVFRVSPHTSQIISLGHSLSSLPIKNQRTGKKALLMGSNGQAFVTVWDQNLGSGEDFKKGDLLVTLSSDQFPTGFFVGQVLAFPFSKKKPQPNIPIKTLISLESLEEVFVVLEPFKKDSFKKPQKL